MYYLPKGAKQYRLHDRYHLSKNQHTLMKKYRVISLVCSHTCVRVYVHKVWKGAHLAMVSLGKAKDFGW